MLHFEVLIRELLAIYRFPASALHARVSYFRFLNDPSTAEAHVATGEVTALEHEIRDHAMELGSGVAKAILASAKLNEVSSGLRNNIVVEFKLDAAGLVYDEVRLGSDAMGNVEVGDWRIALNGQRWGKSDVSPFTSLVALLLASRTGPYQETSK